MSTRAGFISVGIVGAAILIWLALSPAGDVVPTADQPLALESQPSIGRANVNEPERETPEDTAALANAETEIERLRAELAAAEASLEQEEVDKREDSPAPRGYSGAARVFVNDARTIFESELIDSEWAPTAESELYESFVKQISDDALDINVVEVRCRTDACRVQMSFSRPPANPSDLGVLTQSAVDLSVQVAREAKSVSLSGLIQNRANFPGEPATSELFIFRTGNDGIFQAMETPRGTILLCHQASCSGVNKDASAR